MQSALKSIYLLNIHGIGFGDSLYRPSSAPLYKLAILDSEEVVVNCPLSTGEWTKQLAAAKKDFKIDPALSLVQASLGRPPHWKVLLQDPDVPEAREESFHEILEDVMFFSDSIISKAVASLKQLLMGHHVDYKLMKVFDSSKGLGFPAF